VEGQRVIGLRDLFLSSAAMIELINEKYELLLSFRVLSRWNEILLPRAGSPRPQSGLHFDPHS